jgi:glycosyltransferase involved in cell wall biosynthesis
MAKTISMARCVIAIDPATEESVKHRFPNIWILRIPNGVDLRELPASESPSSSRTALFLGWVIPKKGVEELVEAWANLKPKGWRCVIAGPGSDKYREELRQRFHPDGLEFIPEQPHDNAMRLMAAADVFVLPSHTEGFPNVIIEAMAMGKPIIATQVGAIPEMLSDNCGVLIPPRDTDALQTALHCVLADAQLRSELGACANQKAKALYSMDTVFEQCVSIWRKAATSRTSHER